MSEKSFDSDDYPEDFRKLAEVSDDGVEMVYTKLTHEHGENNYHAAHGVEDGVAVAYLFSSNGLERLFRQNDTALKGKSIRIIPRGKDTDRRYRVDLV